MRRSRSRVRHARTPPVIAAVDLFCGAGGLTYGLRKAGILVVAGIDLDPASEFPFTENNGAAFIQADIRDVTGEDLADLYPAGLIRLLAGCAPCRPFSPYRRGTAERNPLDDEWGLVTEFGRLVDELRPDLVTMENVPGLATKKPFLELVGRLERLRYHVAFRSVYCPRLGIPQNRRRLVLLASRAGKIIVPTGSLEPVEYRTVRQAIDRLPAIAAGERDARDRLHVARDLDPDNLARMRASLPGGTWEDWPAELRADCHRKKSGATYKSVYARMAWDEPSPTITTQAHNFGTGRFGHPEQDRPITLREAAILQTFPRSYRFVPPRENVSMLRVGRLIGNAVPPRLAYHVGRELMKAVQRRKRTA